MHLFNESSRISPRELKEYFVNDFGGCNNCGNTDIKQVGIKKNSIICLKCKTVYNMDMTLDDPVMVMAF